MSWGWTHDRFTLIRLSDPKRDGMALELYDGAKSRMLVMEAFYSDLDGSMKFEEFGDVPPEVETDFKVKARELLPPIEP